MFLSPKATKVGNHIPAFHEDPGATLDSCVLIHNRRISTRASKDSFWHLKLSALLPFCLAVCQSSDVVLTWRCTKGLFHAERSDSPNSQRVLGWFRSNAWHLPTNRQKTVPFNPRWMLLELSTSWTLGDMESHFKIHHFMDVRLLDPQSWPTKCSRLVVPDSPTSSISHLFFCHFCRIDVPFKRQNCNTASYQNVTTRNGSGWESFVLWRHFRQATHSKAVTTAEGRCAEASAGTHFTPAVAAEAAYLGRCHVGRRRIVVQRPYGGAPVRRRRRRGAVVRRRRQLLVEERLAFRR